MAVQMTKSRLIEKIAVTNEVAKKDAKGVMATLATIGYSELKKNGVFLVPGFAKFVVIKKPATKARRGTNPFNGEQNAVQGQTCSQDRQSTPGQSCKRRGLIVKRRRRGPFAVAAENPVATTSDAASRCLKSGARRT
jgi:DNA-binding protein HU-beta